MGFGTTLNSHLIERLTLDINTMLREAKWFQKIWILTYSLLQKGALKALICY